MKYAIIVGLVALLAGCGEQPKDPVIGTGPSGRACSQMTVEADGQTLVDQCSALTGGSSGGSVTYFSLLDSVGAFANSSNYALLGPAASFGDLTVWVYGRGTSGPRTNDTDWISFAVPLWAAFGGNCIASSPTSFTDVTPYLDTATLHMRGINGSLNFAGSYRAWGNNVTGGQGAMYRDSSGNNYPLVIKTASGSGGSGIPACPNGPGNVGDIGLMFAPSN